MTMRFFSAFLSFLFLTGTHALAFPWDLPSIQNHINERFLSAKVELDPFPHLVVENILPEDLYIELCDQWPDTSFKGVVQENFVLHIGEFEGQTEKTAQANQIWTEFSLLIFDPMIKKRVGELMRTHAFCRFGQQVNDLALCNGVHLGEHRLAQNHRISAHIDQAYVFAPIILYFPKLEENPDRELGTQFYRHNQNLTSIDFLFDDDVTLVKTVPYKPNTFCSFMQTPSSWHGSKYQNPKRKLYFSNIYLSPQFMAEYYGTSFELDPAFLNQNETY